MSREQWRAVQSTFENKGLQITLLETMNWLRPKAQIDQVIVAGEAVNFIVLAQLPGASFIDIEDLSEGNTKWHRSVDQELKKYFPERITRYRHKSGDSWYWPKKLSSGSLSYDRLHTSHDALPDYLAQRLAGLSFSFDEHSKNGGIAPNTVKERIRGQFESGKVTSDFFAKFKQRHEDLASIISGLPDPKASSSYATLILNRLMFIYFLQKKEFLNGDPDYLKSCLKKVQGLKGKDKFYSFYKDYLLELFFSKLDKQDGVIADPDIEAIAGAIPYINGGVFSKSHAEESFEITIPDSAFEEIFTFFDSYTWHLDTRPTGSPKEINPEVIGYIFEQYINFTAGGKKENGAYYTKHDVTGYMVGQTLVPRIMDEVLALELEPFELLKLDPDAYIHESMKHGFDSDTNAWVHVDGDLYACWEGDPTGWHLLDEAELDFRVCLPDETWVEMFYRRERVEKLRLDLAAGAVKEVNDLITLNLNSQTLLTDCIAQIESTAALDDLWSRVSSLSVIDPTCGSGAFLFAALEVLEDVYARIADRISDVSPRSKIIMELASHPNRRYFLRKHAALRNLYGTDIMEDAIETAKLRIFLALASCLETKDQIEPLPDLDFNLKVGNLVVGFKDANDVSRVENEKLLIDNKLSDLEGDIIQHAGLYEIFLEASNSNLASFASAKNSLESSYISLRTSADKYYAECINRTDIEFETWAIEAKPFHWVIEFPQVMATGGFDVVIGNPPYIQKSKMTASEVADIVGYETNAFNDLFEVCFERSLQLLKKTGRHAFIVMSSLARGSKNQSLRRFISRRETAEWWSTYAIRPSSLFTGIRVRNTILIQGPGLGCKTTANLVFSAKSRAWLFPSIEYAPTNRNPESGVIRGGVIQNIAEVLMSQSAPTLRPGEGQIFFRRSGKYWMPVLLGSPAVFDPDLKKTHELDKVAASVFLWENEIEAVAIAASASKIGYLNWSLLGDDFNVSGVQTLQARAIAFRAKDDLRLRQISERLMASALSSAVLSEYAGAMYLNVLWNEQRPLTDKVDEVLLDCLGQPDGLKKLNIWFRQTVRISRDDNQRVRLSRRFLREEIGWDSL